MEGLIEVESVIVVMMWNSGSYGSRPEWFLIAGWHTSLRNHLRNKDHCWSGDEMMLEV